MEHGQTKISKTIAKFNLKNTNLQNTYTKYYNFKRHIHNGFCNYCVQYNKFVTITITNVKIHEVIETTE